MMSPPCQDELLRRIGEKGALYDFTRDLAHKLAFHLVGRDLVDQVRGREKGEGGREERRAESEGRRERGRGRE